MHRAQPFERRLQPVGQRVIGRVHAGEHRIAPERRHLAGIEHGAEGGDLVVAVIGVPAAADIGFLLRLLAHLGDLRPAVDGAEEAVDVDGGKAFGEGDVLGFAQPLVAEEDHAVLAEGGADLADRVIGQVMGEIDAVQLRADMAGGGADIDGIAGHFGLLEFPVRRMMRAARRKRQRLPEFRPVCHASLRPLAGEVFRRRLVV